MLITYRIDIDIHQYPDNTDYNLVNEYIHTVS